MFQILHKWFINDCHYWKGVVIYESMENADPSLVISFKNSRSTENENLLKSLLLEYYNKAKESQSIQPEPLIVNTSNKNILLEACQKEASDAYKKMMNKRAVLFALVKKEINTQENIEVKKKLALEVVTDYKQVTNLYDKVVYVKTHNKLPEPVKAQKSIDDIPDFMIKQSIDNLRKNINKLKKKEPTSKRISLLQSHNSTLENLLSKWHSLTQ